MGAIAIALLVVAMVGAPQASQQAERNRDAADARERSGLLLEIAKHEGAHAPREVGAAIAAGLRDPNPVVRELALTVVISRAAGPMFSPDARADWIADREFIQALREQVVGALRDPNEDVREQAVGALASLDFDLDAKTVRLTALTVETLVARFYQELSAGVRAKIVAGFGTDRNAGGDAVRKLLLDAFADSSFSVRHAAFSGIDKLEPAVALSLVIERLSDQEVQVRLQAAIALARFRSLIPEQRATIRRAAEREKDPQVLEFLRRVDTQ